MLHLINYVPELRGKSEIIEEPLPAQRVKISLRHIHDAPKQAYLAPGRQPLAIEHDGEYASVIILEMCGYQLVVFE